MKRLHVAAICLLASSTSAFAADLLTESTHDWSGFSAGVFGGWEWSSFDQTELHTDAFGGGWWFPPGPNPAYSYDEESGIYGGQIGWDHQSGNLVAGLGFELGSMNIDVHVVDPNSPPIPVPGPAGPETDLSGDLFGSLTARVGYASDRWLFYVRGGVSALDTKAVTVDECARSFCGQLTIDAKEKTWLLGATAGVGVDYAITDNITVGAEYRLYKFEDISLSDVASNGLEYDQTISPDIINTARLNVTFAF